MTDHEKERQLLSLTPGDVVEMKYAGRAGWYEAVVEMVNQNTGMIIVRPVGLTASGRRRAERRYNLNRAPWMMSSIRLPIVPPGASRLRANVFADYLDDRGFPDAARCLREAFPLMPVEESNE